jgi:hypothetical protein
VGIGGHWVEIERAVRGGAHFVDVLSGGETGFQVGEPDRLGKGARQPRPAWRVVGTVRDDLLE